MPIPYSFKTDKTKYVGELVPVDYFLMSLNDKQRLVVAKTFIEYDLRVKDLFDYNKKTNAYDMTKYGEWLEENNLGKDGDINKLIKDVAKTPIADRYYNTLKKFVKDKN